MLTVEPWEAIRRKVLVEGCSQRGAAQELGHSRKTVAKALAEPVPPGYRLKEPRKKPVMGPVAHLIEAWLEQEKDWPRKQRQTAQRIYERLMEERKEFRGHPGTVRRYIQGLARRRGGEVYMPLAFEPGEEAQVDWHDGWAFEDGHLRKMQVFVMTLCYSKASFECSYERANLESFLDGHVRAFEHWGGVPGRLAYDNLRCAVIQVLRGKERRLNERFVQMRSWYLFDSRFCNVERGNEKGNVENQVKRSERTYLTPPPDITEGGLPGLNQKLLAGCVGDLERPAPAPHTGQKRRELFAQERACLRPLPAARFEACVQHATFADKRSLVQTDTNRYSVPVGWAYHPALIKAFADRIEIWCGQEKVAQHPREFAKGQYVLTPEHYLPLLALKPGSLDNARAFKGQPWGQDFERFRKELEYRREEAGTRQYIDTLLLMTKHPPEEVKRAVSLCVQRRAFAYEAVLGVLRNEPVRALARLDLSDRPELVIEGDGIRPAAIYDHLRVAEEAVA